MKSGGLEPEAASSKPGSSKLLAGATVRALATAACARFKSARLSYGHGTTGAWDEAVYLVLHGLRLPPDQLTTYLARKVTAVELQRVLRLIEARVERRIPAAYLTHEAWLGDYRFYVDERVIVPRSFIAELLREQLTPWVTVPAAIRSALDFCTGSGCLAILLARSYPAASIDATDISPEALAVARRNVAAYRLRKRVRLLQSDMFSGIRGKRYQLIIANPPYVSAGIVSRLPREYRHEPRLALASGRDGFDAVRIILREAAAHLVEDGLLVVEVGHNRQRLEAAFPRLPFIWPQTSGGDDCVFILRRCDLAGAGKAVPVAPSRASRAVAGSRRRSIRKSGRA